MANNQPPPAVGVQLDDIILKFGLTPDQMKAYISAGVIKPGGDGVVVVEAGKEKDGPKFYRAELANSKYHFVAVADEAGNKSASLDLKNGLGISARNGLINAQVNKTGPILGGTGEIHAEADNRGHRSIGLKFNKEF